MTEEMWEHEAISTFRVSVAREGGEVQQVSFLIKGHGCAVKRDASLVGPRNQPPEFQWESQRRFHQSGWSQKGRTRSVAVGVPNDNFPQVNGGSLG